MSREYRQMVEKRYEDAIDNLLKDSPAIVCDFYGHMANGKREMTTQSSYVRDVLDFLKFEINHIPELEGLPVKNFPIKILDKLTLQDMDEYKKYLFKERELTNSSAKKKLCALSAFYKYCCMTGLVHNNPMTNFEFPVINKKRIIKLDAELSNQLLEGILANDKYLATSEFGDFVVDIPPAVWLKRERSVLRNYAICTVLLGVGLRVSEMVGLDMNDINFKNNTIKVIVKGGDETEVYFGDDVAAALKAYIDGPEPPPHLFDHFSPASDVVAWAQLHINDDKLTDNILKKFPDMNHEEINDVQNIVDHYRRQGRKSFKPARNCNAVFLSNRGTRLTVRMVELMIKEMAQTYLPEYDDKDIFSPHKLRATCATRILTQTGNIELASTQLNHKGVAVTAAFYAELQREQRKDKLTALNIKDW